MEKWVQEASRNRTVTTKYKYLVCFTFRYIKGKVTFLATVLNENPVALYVRLCLCNHTPCEPL